MRAVDFRVRLFLDEHDRERSERAMHFLLHALCCIDGEILKTFPAIPPLYRSGVCYDTAHAGKPEWQDILDTVARKKGDCKDLACWRVAELRLRGIRARPYIRYKLKPVRVGGLFGSTKLVEPEWARTEIAPAAAASGRQRRLVGEL